MLVKDLRKIMAGLEDDTELEIRDEVTEETYAIHKLQAVVCEGASIETSECKLIFTINIQEQTASYVIS